MAATSSNPVKSRNNTRSALQALTSAAMLLPGIIVPPTHAAEGDSDLVSIQYNRYSESERDLISVDSSLDPLSIEVFRATANLILTDRKRLSFSYSQDTWSGATPVTTAPLAADPNRSILQNTPAGVVSVGASPFADTQVLLTRERRPLSASSQQGLIEDPRNVLVLASASPESRDQLDFQLAYDWDSSAVNFGSGFSVENDYQSIFANVSGRVDFNQQTTSLSYGAGYTANEVSAILDPDFTPYLTTRNYQDSIRRVKDSDVLYDDNHEVTLHAGLTQVINQGALIDIGLGYSHRQGFLENPYKATTVLFINPDTISSNLAVPINSDAQALMEQRPEQRDQIALRAKYVQYIEPFDAALHLSWEQSRDNWGIDTQAFAIDWVQPLPAGWTLTPRLRYYSQDSATFYQDYLISEQAFRKIAIDSHGRQIWHDANDSDALFFRQGNGEYLAEDGTPVDGAFLNLLPNIVNYDAKLLPKHFSSDHRLSGFGSLSGGLSLNKSWNNGVSFEAGIEYYDRRSDLKLGGSGNSGFADFDFWVANAAITVRPSAGARALPVGRGEGRSSMPGHSHSDHSLPAGIMFGHMMNNPGQFMVGYRYAFARRAGELSYGSDSVDDPVIVDQGCPGTDGCRLVPSYMNMKMHMLDIMYAPTSWLTLMFMPQFVDMDMNLRDLNGRPPPVLETHEHSGISGHTTGGLSDAVVAGLFRLYEDSNHHLHFGLGVSMPLGSVDQELRRTFRNDGGLIHFGMQLGSGTWDLLPSLTYSGNAGRWSWGAQLSGVEHLGQKNESGYKLGDMAKVTSWAGYGFTDQFRVSLRTSYASIDAISGGFDQYNAGTGPMDFPQNQGGNYLDAGIGLSYNFSGNYQGNQVSLEWMQPLREDVNGFQRKRDGALAAIWQLNL